MAGKDREKELARQKFERQQARRAAEEAAARRNKALGGVAAAVVGVAAIGGLIFALKSDDKKDPKATTSPSSAPSASATPTASAKPGECLYNKSAEKAAKDVGKPPAKPEYSDAVEATVKMNVGEVKFELDGKKAPCSTNSFAYLAKKGYFDNTKCHRLTENVLQCGDPAGTGGGGPGYQFGIENTKDAKYTKGVLAMARTTDPETNGSQFFIVYKDWTDLPPDYSIFGKVTGGMDVIDEVGRAGFTAADATGNTAPKKKVEIDSVTIAKK